MSEGMDHEVGEDAGSHELVISRLIDGRARPEDWRLLRESPRAGEFLVELESAQRVEAALCGAVDRELGAAERVEAPHEAAAHEWARRGAERRLRLAGTWGGWAAAAALVLAWGFGGDPPAGGGSGSPGSAAPSGGQQRAGVLTAGGGPEGAGAERLPSFEAALDQYVRAGRESGRIVQVDPRLRVVDSAPLEDGSGVEVVYMRRVLERAVVDDVYRYTQDEFGRMVPVRMESIPRESDPM